MKEIISCRSSSKSAPRGTLAIFGLKFELCIGSLWPCLFFGEDLALRGLAGSCVAASLASIGGLGFFGPASFFRGLSSLWLASLGRTWLVVACSFGDYATQWGYENQQGGTNR